MNQNLILWDCHMHSSFSGDSHTPMESMIQKAIQLQLQGICLTEHYDPDYPSTPDGTDFSLSLDMYQKCLFSLREKYKEKITVQFGIELGLQPHLSSFFSELTAQYPFDFVIGSSHLVHGQDPYYPGYFQNRTEAESYREYFLSVLENLSSCPDIDVYGHLDYIVRYGPTQNKYFHYSDYRDLLDEILKKLVRKHIGLEINTGGYHYGLGQPNPCAEVVRRYKELGGEIITIGADAHSPEKISYAFDLVSHVLMECGFRYYTVFQERTPVFLKL